MTTKARNRTPARRKVWPLANPITIAMDGAAALTLAQISTALQPAEHALRVLQFGAFGLPSWRALADAFKVAQALAEQNIANDHADKFEAVLAALHARHTTHHTWAARALELQTMKDALYIHEIQLNACCQLELERAVQTVTRRCAQALAGNAGAGVAVLAGLEATA